MACWKSATAGSAYCLRDPLKRSLAQITYSPAFAPIA
jgi:hypothetical protein